MTFRITAATERKIFMPHVSTSSIAGILVAGFVSSADAHAPGSPWQPRTRIEYVSVADKNGAQVADLQAADLEVKVGGKIQQVIGVRPAMAPLRIAVLDADGATGAFQLGIARFMQKLLGRAEFALVSVITQPQRIVDYSADAPTLSAGVSRLGTRGREVGAQLMEAIQDATKDVYAEGKRAVIVVLRIGGENPTDLSGNDVREQLRKSGAILYVISTLGALRSAPSQARGTDAVSVQQGQLHDSELADAANNLSQVLGDGSKESGGRHEHIISTTLVPSLEGVADELLHQYEVTYALTDGVRPGDKLSVSSKRKGVTVRAPSRLPGL
jgi:hypothetical protein